MLMSLGSAAKPQKPVSHFPFYPSVAATQPSKRDARLSRAVSATGLRLLLLSLLQDSFFEFAIAAPLPPPTLSYIMRTLPINKP